MTPARRPLLAALLAFFMVAGQAKSPAAGLYFPAAPWTVARLPLVLPPAALAPLRVPEAGEVPAIPQAGPLGDTIQLSPEEALRIGRLIWRNESGGTFEGLTHWNVGEDFASLGIAHFIWYPEGRRGPFTESFPPLLAFLLERNAPEPDWLAEARGCPWPDRAAFLADFRSPRMSQLRQFLADTVDLQARFAADRLEGALPKILESATPAERAQLRARFYAVAATPKGVYALVDYVNFKGEGTNPTERYAGRGWGLLQVLESMPDTVPGPQAAADFSDAARRTLERRVADSPPERDESRWLEGWRRRVETYQPG